MRLAILMLLLLLPGCNGSAPSSASLPAGQGPKRIVSLAPNVTEIIFALGLGPQVVAVTRNDGYPEEVKKLPRVGDMVVDFETLLALRPDLVVLDSNLNVDHLPRLEQLGLPLCKLDSSNLAGMKQALVTLGERTGRQQQARQQLEQLTQAEAQARARSARWTQRPRVFAEIYREPLMTAGQGTYVHELLELAGMVNCFGDLKSYPTVSQEELLKRDPDLIILTTDSAEEFARLPGWSACRAVRAGHVYRIPEDLLVRPTPRLAQALPVLQGWAEGL